MIVYAVIIDEKLPTYNISNVGMEIFETQKLAEQYLKSKEVRLDMTYVPFNVEAEVYTADYVLYRFKKDGLDHSISLVVQPFIVHMEDGIRNFL